MTASRTKIVARTAATIWEGPLDVGSGTVASATGAFDKLPGAAITVDAVRERA